MCRERYFLAIISCAFVQPTYGEQTEKSTIALYSKIEAQAPELLEYSDHFGIKKMSRRDAPFLWLAGQIDTLEEAGFVVNFSILQTNDDVEARAVKQAIKSEKTITFQIMIKSDDRGASQANNVWSKLVAQSYMLESVNSVKMAALDVRVGSKTSLEYATEISRIYYESALKIKSFFDSKWKPWSLSEGCIPISTIPWFVHAELETIDKWNQQQKRNGNFQNWERIAKKIAEDR